MTIRLLSCIAWSVLLSSHLAPLRAADESPTSEKAADPAPVEVSEEGDGDNAAEDAEPQVWTEQIVVTANRPEVRKIAKRKACSQGHAGYQA